MPKPRVIQLGRAVEIPILYEDRSVLALDKPAGWMLLPTHWDRTAQNLQLAITSSIRSGDFWARSRNLKFLRFVHRLDADTTGVLLFAKSAGAVSSYSRLFESRQMEKLYHAVVLGCPPRDRWACRVPIAPDPNQPGRMITNRRAGKEAETLFRVLYRARDRALLEAMPLTGRTHQIRVHLAHTDLPVIGDSVYGRDAPAAPRQFPLGLRAVSLAYRDPFTRRPVKIGAPVAEFHSAFGFDPAEAPS